MIERDEVGVRACRLSDGGYKSRERESSERRITHTHTQRPMIRTTNRLGGGGLCRGLSAGCFQRCD